VALTDNEINVFREIYIYNYYYYPNIKLWLYLAALRIFQNNFTEISKNSARRGSENNKILLDHQNNYTGNSSMSNAANNLIF